MFFLNYTRSIKFEKVFKKFRNNLSAKITKVFIKSPLISENIMKTERTDLL